MAAPSRNPAPVFHPPMASEPQVPSTATTTRIRPIRTAATSKLRGSGAVVIGIPQDLPDQRHEPGHAPQDQEDNFQPGRAERLVEVIADRVSHESRRRQQYR